MLTMPFFTGDSGEDVFTQRTPWLCASTISKACLCKLQKAIYGLRQAPRARYNELGTFLTSMGFINSKSDTSLFLRQQNRITIYLSICGTILLFMCNDPLEILDIPKAIGRSILLKDLSTLSYFLGVEATFTSSDLLLSQRKYIQDLLSKTNMQDAKEVTTPLSINESFKLCDGSPRRTLLNLTSTWLLTRF
ncbi:unnamed protein product [Musa textilis]